MERKYQRGGEKTAPKLLSFIDEVESHAEYESNTLLETEEDRIKANQALIEKFLRRGTAPDLSSTACKSEMQEQQLRNPLPNSYGAESTKLLRTRPQTVKYELSQDEELEEYGEEEEKKKSSKDSSDMGGSSTMINLQSQIYQVDLQKALEGYRLLVSQNIISNLGNNT
jgi:hypothetical protein